MNKGTRCVQQEAIRGGPGIGPPLPLVSHSHTLILVCMPWKIAAILVHSLNCAPKMAAVAVATSH